MGWKNVVRERLDRVTGATTAARLVLATIRVCLRYRVTGLASEAAFFMMLSLPPLVLGMFGGVGYIGRLIGPGSVRAIVTGIRSWLGQFLTQDALSETVMPTIGAAFQNGRFDLISIGFVLSLWSGSRALNVFIDTISIMYGQSGLRGIVRTRALSFSMYGLSVLVGAVVLPLLVIGPTLTGRALGEGWRWLGVLYWPVVVIAAIVVLSGLFHIATPMRAPLRRDVPGAVLTLVLWVLASYVLRATISESLDGTTIYGPLSTPIVILIWFYAIAISVLIGAALNAGTRELWPVKLHAGAGTQLAHWARSRRERRRGPGVVDEPGPSGGDERAAAIDGQFLDPDWEHPHERA